LVTKAKKGGNSAKIVLEKSLTPEAFEKIIKEIAPSFGNRQGGYTRLIKVGKRLGDNTSMVLIEWTEVIKRTSIATESKPKKEVKITKKVTAKPTPKTKKSPKITKKVKK
jgi:large subunit ribosomal protein L17